MLQIKLLTVKASSVKFVGSRDTKCPFEILQMKSANRAQGDGAFQTPIPRPAARQKKIQHTQAAALHLPSQSGAPYKRLQGHHPASSLSRTASVHTWLVILAMKQSRIQVFPYRRNISSEIRDLICLGSSTSQSFNKANHLWGMKYPIDLEAR